MSCRLATLDIATKLDEDSMAKPSKENSETVVAAVINSYANGDDRLCGLLWACVGRVVMKGSRDMMPVEIIQMVPRAALVHITDWLRSAVLDDAPWLSNVDLSGRPKKLLKFGSLGAIYDEADKAMLRKVRGARRSALPDGSEETYMELTDGYRLVRMLTPEALDMESAEMQHCIGHGSYDDQLGDPGVIFLSLRDPSGNAHATVQIREGVIEQLSGKQNELPARKYLEVMKSFFANGAISPGDFGSGAERLFIDVDGNAYSWDDLPENLEVRGNIEMEDREYDADECAVVFPRTLKTPGNLIVSVSEQDSPPARIEAGGDIDLFGDGLLVLPELDIHPSMSLEIRHTRIRELAAGLNVANLVVVSSPLQSVPDDLVCSGDITLVRTEVGKLPPSLWHLVGGVPTSRGSVILKGSEVSDLGGLRGVNGSLDLSKTGMEALPEGLRVESDLRISNTDITEIPEGTWIGRNLVAEDCKISLGRSSMAVRGDCVLNSSEVSFPVEFMCMGSIRAESCEIARMPERLVCRGNVDFDNCTMTAMPSYLRANHLSLVNAKLDRIEGDVRVKEIVVGDRPFSFGPDVKAETIVVSGRSRTRYRMNFEDGVRYLAGFAETARIDDESVRKEFNAAQMHYKPSPDMEKWHSGYQFSNVGFLPGSVEMKLEGIDEMSYDDCSMRVPRLGHRQLTALVMDIDR